MSADAILLRDLGRWCDTTLASPRLLVGLQLLRPRRGGVLHERKVWMVVGMRALDGRRLAWRLRSLDRPHAEEEAHHPDALAAGGAQLYRCPSTDGVVLALTATRANRMPQLHVYDTHIAALASALAAGRGA